MLLPVSYNDYMKLYLSSYRIPTPKDFEKLLEKPLNEVSVALISNAKDYYVKRARDFTVDDLVKYMKQLGLKVDVVDLRDYSDAVSIKQKLAGHDAIWAMGGNTYMLRYEMQRSGFDQIIKELLDSGVIYGGDSAGALVAGQSIAGVESADEPEFAEEYIADGLNLIPYVVLPHIDNPEFVDVLPIFKKKHQDKEIIELKDSQAVIFSDDNHRTVEGQGL
jgi:dipeptidase E